MKYQWHEVFTKEALKGFHCGISEGTVKYLETLRNHSQLCNHFIICVPVPVKKNITRNTFFSSFHKSNQFLGLGSEGSKVMNIMNIKYLTRISSSVLYKW